MKKKRKKEKEEKFHCYKDKTLFNYDICSKDKCKWIDPCSVWCGNTSHLYEQVLVGVLIDKIERHELLELLMFNYNISYNASEMAVKRWKKKKEEN